MKPTSIAAKRSSVLHLTVPCESATAATVAIRVDAPKELALTGDTSWHGRSRGVVDLTLNADPAAGGDYALKVRQRYSDGEVVDWAGSESSNAPAPVVHVTETHSNARDRVIIAVVAAGVLAAWLVLRRRGERT